MKMTFVVGLLMIGGAVAAAGGRCRGVWAASGDNPFRAGPSKARLTSPDGRYSVAGSRHGLSVRGPTRSVLLAVEANRPLTEVLWSPDSRLLAVNVSDGGLVGTWEASVFDPTASAPLEQLLVEVRKAVADFPNCDSPEQANLAIVGWTQGGKEMLVVAEVPPHSSCKNMANIIGFRVDAANGAILERLPEALVRRHWSAVLGCRFSTSE